MITAGIVTRNRPDLLRSCLASLELISDRLAEIVVVDDTSDVAAADSLDGLPPAVACRLRIVRQTAREGYIVGRNRIVREATTEHVLLMDDDARLIDAAGIDDAVAVLEGSPSVGAVAFAMATDEGAPWDAPMQPAPVEYTCRVPCFIGFAHLLRRSIFLHLGGYREPFQFYGEEKEYCLRLLSAGHHVVYLPHARVVHMATLIERNHSRYLRLTIRNDCLAAIYNEPLPLPLLSIPIRLLRYFRMRGGTPDPGGLRWIVRDLIRSVPSALALRRAVRWSTWFEWRRIRRISPAWWPDGSAAKSSRTITVGVNSCNRPARLLACLRSLAVLGDLVSAIVVVDDASDVPVKDALGDLPPEIARKLTLIRQTDVTGNIGCRNIEMRRARTDDVLLLDDDTELLDAGTVRRGLALMDGDARVAAVGFAMAKPDGSLLPDGMQPSPARYVCYVPSYVGFAHLIRRGAFWQVGGYREMFRYHGEEKECCLRLIDAGYDIVFMPEPVVHAVDPANRDLKRYLKTVIRNDCLGSLLNEPWPMPLVSVPIRLARYERMRKAAGVADPGGLRWIVTQLGQHLPAIRRQRKPVKWATVFRWRRLRREWPPYHSQAGVGHSALRVEP
jgi:GT2 family glycosyltransferase